MKAQSQPISAPAVTERARAGHPAYGRIFILLAVFTVLEVAASYLPEYVKIPLLIILAVTKALMVLLYFMHLRTDHRIYSYAMILGAIIVIPIILVIILVMPSLYFGV